MKTKKARHPITLRQCTVLRRLCDERIARLNANIAKAAGSLYPSIWTAEIEEIKALFESLTGFPLE